MPNLDNDHRLPNADDPLMSAPNTFDHPEFHNDDVDELEFLIVLFNCVLPDTRHGGYKRRSNTVTPGFRRHQRRGHPALAPQSSPPSIWPRGR